MSEANKARIEALRYAVYLCETRKAAFKTEGFNVACDEIKLFLEAAIERLEHGEDMQSYAVVQEAIGPTTTPPLSREAHGAGNGL